MIHPDIVLDYAKNTCKLSRITYSNVYVYFITDGQYVKIGKAKNVKERIKELQSGNGRKLSVLFTIQAPNICYSPNDNLAYAIESFLHKTFKDYRLQGEWFDILNIINVQEWSKYFEKHQRKRRTY